MSPQAHTELGAAAAPQPTAVPEVAAAPQPTDVPEVAAGPQPTAVPEVAAGPAQRDRPAPGPVETGGTAAEPAPQASLPNARSALELIGLVVAPTTLVTALAFYFGWVMTNSRASYFGIDASALGYSTQDYLLRSADALFVPLGAIVVFALAGVCLHGFAIRQLADRSRRTRVRLAARAAVVAGGVLFALGLVAVFKPLPLSPGYLFAPASPGVGIALLAEGLYLLGRVAAAASPAASTAPPTSGRATAIALVALLIVLSAFWTASEYAKALGRGRAQTFAASLVNRPHVTVLAPKRLDIKADGVVERRLSGNDLAYRYRYSGLRLLVRSAGKYFVLPDRWTRARGAAIVLADSPDYRFEFESGGRR